MHRPTTCTGLRGMRLASTFCSVLFLVAVSADIVQHYAVPGNVPSTKTGEAEAVIAEVYVKLVQNVTSRSRKYRGIAFFAPVEPRYHTWYANASARTSIYQSVWDWCAQLGTKIFPSLCRGGDLSMPPAVVGWNVPVYLTSVTTGVVYNATVRDNYRHREHEQKGETRLAMPVRFYGELPDTDDFYELHIRGWDRFAYVSATEPETIQHGPAPEVWIVLPPLRNIRTSDAATLLAHNVRYHIAMGFNITAYVLLPQLEAFRQHVQLQQYIRSKQLELVLWNDISECQHFPSCQHTMETSHAGLAAWGTLRLLMFLDIDEYVAFSSNVSVRSFVDRCCADNSQVVLPRYDVGCSQCENESDVWFVSSTGTHPLTHYDVVMRS